MWPFRSRWSTRRRQCWHHSPIRRAVPGDLGAPAQSFIESKLIDLGRGKMFWCRECGKTWFA